MAKRIEIDGKFYRMRRGKLVEIPHEWLGRMTTRKTIRQRQSKLTGPVKRAVKNDGGPHHYTEARRMPVEDE